MVKFNIFFSTLASIFSVFPAFGTNFIEVADYYQKFGILEHPVCF